MIYPNISSLDSDSFEDCIEGFKIEQSRLGFTIDKHIPKLQVSVYIEKKK